MATLTLLQFWTDEIGRLNTALTNAKSEQTAASSAEATAISDYTAAGKALQDAKDALDAIRKKLATIPMPADGDPLLDQMRAALITWRKAAADHLAKDKLKREKRLKREYWTGRVTVLSARLNAAEAEKKKEDKSEAQKDAWAALVAAAPLKDVPTDADAALTAFATPAQTKVEGDFPENASPDKDFLTRVRARRELGELVADAAENVANNALTVTKTWTESTTRESAKTPALLRAYQVQLEALRAFTEAPKRLEQASKTLEALANRVVSPLTAAQRAELITADATLKGDREDALVLLKDRDDAQIAAFNAKAVYAAALFAAQTANPDKTEAELIAADAALKTKHDDVIAKEGLVTTADTALAGDLPTLQRWFAAVPDALWEQLEALDRSIAELTELKTVVPADLVTDLEMAEDDLAKNLEAVSQEQRKIDLLQDGLMQSQVALAAELELEPRRQQTAARFVELV